MDAISKQLTISQPLCQVILVDGKATNMHVHFAFQDTIEKGHNILRTAGETVVHAQDLL